MRLHVSMSIFTVYVAIISKAAANRTVVAHAPVLASTSSSSSSGLGVDAKRPKLASKNHDEIIAASEMVNMTNVNVELSEFNDDARREKAFEFVMKIAKKFSSNYITKIGANQDGYVVYPLMEFVKSLTFDIENQRHLLPSLPEDRLPMVKLGLKTLIPRLNDYMIVKSSDSRQETIEIFPASLHYYQAFGLRQYSVIGSMTWFLLFDSSITITAPFYFAHNNESSEMIEFIYTKQRCRYGKIDVGTFIEITANKNNSEDGPSMFIIRPDDENDFRLLKSRLGQINLNELRAKSSDADVHMFLPKFSILDDLRGESFASNVSILSIEMIILSMPATDKILSEYTHGKK